MLRVSAGDSRPLVSQLSYVGLAQHPQGPESGMDHAAPRLSATRPNARILQHSSRFPEGVRAGIYVRDTQRSLHRVRDMLAYSAVHICLSQCTDPSRLHPLLPYCRPR